MKIFVVIPTVRNIEFLKSWKSEFKKCHILIIEDNPTRTVSLPKVKCASIKHFSWKEIDEDLGDNKWIISRRNSGIRNYGFLKAYQYGADYVITLDDDCYPAETDFVKKHIDNLDSKNHPTWINTYPDPKWMYTRGFPYQGRTKVDTVLSHGLWTKSIDLDAQTEIKLKKSVDAVLYPPIRSIIPKGYYYPMCIMNLAVKRSIVPIMYFPLMGKDFQGKSYKYNRFDDIWAGIFSKKIIDYLGFSVINGSPFVEHRKASNVNENLVKEFEGIKFNEKLWKLVDKVKLTKKTPRDCYIELAKKINFPNNLYFNRLREAMLIWARLF